MPSPSITLYTTPGCSACAAVKRYLEHKGLAFEEKDVTTDPAYLDEMKRVSNVRIAPVTVIGERAFYGAFDQQRPGIDAALATLQGGRE
ncbi:glutaredoxin family protein [soil metagenome]|nr:glutaredoxin family protein [Deinococcota bacterium]